MSDAQPAASEPAWHAGLPSPRATPESISQDEVAGLIKSSDKVTGKDYLIIDVRRTDFEVCTVHPHSHTVVSMCMY